MVHAAFELLKHPRETGFKKPQKFCLAGLTRAVEQLIFSQ